MADETTSRVLADPQDPLPEANWLWRRVFTFVALAASFGILIGLGYATNRIVGNIVGRLDTMDAANVTQITVAALTVIEQMFRMMFYVVLVTITYYMIAPSAEQITKVIQTAGLLKQGVQITSRARVTTPEREEETTAAVGVPPVAPVPPEAPAVAPEADSPPDEAPWAAEQPKG